MWFAIGACLWLSAAAGEKEFEVGKVRTIQADDLHYALRVPRAHKQQEDDGLPTILFIHGSNMRGENYVGSLESASELKDWMLIGPTGPKQAGDDAFNHDPGDERYIEKIIDDVEKRLALKIGRLYVGGHSQGAFLSHAVAAHLPDRVDGVLAVSGGSWTTPKELVRKGKGRKGLIPIALVHAQDDPVVDFLASVEVYDAYVKAKHADARLFAPAEGAHMFMRLPILDALRWLDLMNEDRPSEVRKVLSSTKASDDPRTAWDAANVADRLADKKGGNAAAARKQIEADARKRAKDIKKRIGKAKKGIDEDLAREAWTFLADYGMVEGQGEWRQAFDKSLGR